jgi:hypothetical protein
MKKMLNSYISEKKTMAIKGLNYIENNFLVKETKPNEFILEKK